MTLLADLQEFVHDHCPHDGMTADATEPEPNGYRLTVAWPGHSLAGSWRAISSIAGALSGQSRSSRARPRRPLSSHAVRDPKLWSEARRRVAIAPKIRSACSRVPVGTAGEEAEAEGVGRSARRQSSRGPACNHSLGV